MEEKKRKKKAEPRSDRRKSIKKVAKELAKNPNLSQRELSGKTGLGKSTVGRAIEDLGQMGPKNDDIIRITNADKKIIKKAQLIVELAIDKAIEKANTEVGIDMGEAMKASSLAKDSTARYAIFRGKDDDGSADRTVIITI